MDIIQELLKLIKINTKISSLHSSDDVLKEIMNEAMSLTGTARAFILEVSASRDLNCVSQYRSSTVELATETGWSSNSALEAHDLKRTVYSTHALDSSDASPSIVKGNIQTVISAPISTGEGPALILQLVGQDATRIDSQTLSLLNLLISQAQVTISKAKLEEAALQNAALAATGELAAQVAHDVRSPLAALDSALKDMGQIPEERRILIRSAVGRIRDIANNLIEKSRTQAEGSSPTGSDTPQLLSSLIDSLVSEKRLQFRSQLGVEIELRLDASSYGVFAAVQPVEFKRLISNLVNNAVEAFGESSGTVSVGLSSRDGDAIVSVQDNGKGIPPEVLARLGQRGETHGKAGGSGLGLHHARTSAESWGGRLELASEVGKGTTATLVLPLAPAPDWFVPEIRLTPGKAVVILDDDASIHQVWQGRLDVLKAAAQGVEIVHVSSPVEIRGWIKANEAKAEQALYLFDYELLGHRDTGLSLAEELGLGARVVLVTSRSEEPEVMAGCRRLKARLIPKGLAGSVPIIVKAGPLALAAARERHDAVLIDDDPLTRMIWENAASDTGKRLRTFSTAAEFFTAAGEIDRATPIYMDSNLGEGVEGAAESLRVHELGFGEIYLATGHEPGRFATLKHLRGVIGKDPPWSV